MKPFFFSSNSFLQSVTLWQTARENISGSLGREWFNTDRVKSGNFGHEVIYFFIPIIEM